MTRIITFSFILFLGSLTLSAQTIRTDVTVIGSGAAGMAAGIQAARSGVKSLILDESKTISAVFTSGDLLSLERIRDHYIYKTEDHSSKKDSVKRPNIRQEDALQVLKSISDTVKNLTMMLNSGIREIKKERRGWEIKLVNGRTVKTDVIVDAGNDPEISAFLNVDRQKTVIQLGSWISSPAAMPKVYRTSFGWGALHNKDKISSYLLPAATLMPVGVENVFLIPLESKQNQPEMMVAGQAAGASAAFCAFFKTTSKNLNVRVTQGELLAFDSRLIPFSDVKFDDRHAAAFQHIGLTGILKAKTIPSGMNEEFVFDTLAPVSSEELRLPMKEYYSRSQIWFADHKNDSLTIGDAINLLMFTATRGEELRREIEAGWQSSFKFSFKYDPKRIINRREFAVLTDTYLQPFNIRIDFAGNLMN